MAPRRRLDDVRKPQILAAASQLLVEKGLSAVRIADVAARAGTSSTSVIYYFGSKAQLFEEAIAEADDGFYAEMLADIEQLDSGADRLAWLVVGSSSVDWILWIDLWVYARRHPEMLEAHRRFDRRFRGMLAGTIRHGAARGEFAPPGDVDEVSLRLGSLMRGLAIHVALGGFDSDGDAMVRHTLRVAALELGCDEALLLAAAERHAAAAAGAQEPAA